ncbi:caspase family protein [Asanoa sp. WMMD1127]|uniref:caspase family protein n=1 Tax=Asanoa sp. WMMD1127 TaxID=3016107 RepID=UPI0024165AA8|nr:caspase family protein [Asanoa sp. WMMD1127]MDG4820584.1 caspase family protein [Asanoa sp. WMMD1127]
MLIGSATYDSGALHDLPAVTNNLIDLYATLTDPTLCGLRTEHAHFVPQPRLPDVGITIEVAAQKATDVLLVYYSGHGIPMDGGELYLALGQTMPEYVAYTALSFSLVRKALANSPARHRILILDCCFSGRAIEAMADPSSLVAGQTEISGSYTLTSVGKNVTAIAKPGERHTAFTGALLGLLRNGVAGAPELLSLRDLYRSVRHHQHVRGLPEPQQRGTGFTDEIALARNVANSTVLTNFGNRHEPVDVSVTDLTVEARVVIQDMRQFEREFRTRLVAFFQQQLRQLPSVRPAPAGLERFVHEYKIRLTVFLQGRITEAEGFRMREARPTDDRQLQQLLEFIDEYRTRLKGFLVRLHQDVADYELPEVHDARYYTHFLSEHVEAHLAQQLSLFTEPG